MNKLKKQFYPLYYFFNRYRGRSVISIIGLTISGFSEAFSFAALFPLIKIGMGGEVDSSSRIGAFFQEFFVFLGLELSIGNVLFVITAFMVLKSILLFISMLMVGYTAQDVVADLRAQFVRSALAAKWSFFSSEKTGEMAIAMGSESDRALKSYTCGAEMISGLIQIAFYGSLAMAMSLTVTLSAFGVSVFSFLILHRFIQMAKDAGIQQTASQKSLFSMLLDGFRGVKVLKAMGKEKQLESMLVERIESLKEANKKDVLSSKALMNAQEPLRVVFVVVGLYFFMGFWKGGVESLLVLLLLFYRTVGRLGDIQKQYQKVVSLSPSFWFFINSIKRAEADVETWDGTEKAEFSKGISLEKVSFSYGTKKVLDELSLDIPYGKLVALVGESGSGKTTIADLVIGLNRADSGKILIDGKDITQLSMQSWRERIGYVPQETYLFHDTIKKNIELQESYSDEEVLEALRKSGAESFIKSLGEGIHYNVGEHGSKLSGGQRQRIAIARSLIRKPALLVMDESTTALDPDTEKEIIQTLESLKGELTILAISHQPAIQKAAETVYYLKRGVIQEKREG